MSGSNEPARPVDLDAVEEFVRKNPYGVVMTPDVRALVAELRALRAERDELAAGDPRLARSVAAVQNAHDLLELGLRAADNGSVDLDPSAYAALAGALNVACWVLGHPNPALPTVLSEIRRDLEAAGVRVVLVGEPGGPS